MRSPNIQLTLTGRLFTIAPLPPHLHSACTADDPCKNPATHRLLSRRTADVKLLCDSHTVEWAREEGYAITSVSPSHLATADSTSIDIPKS